MEVSGTVVSVDEKTVKVRLDEPIEIVAPSDEQPVFKRIRVQVSGNIVPHNLLDVGATSEFDRAIAQLCESDFSIPSGTAVYKVVAELVSLARICNPVAIHFSSFGVFAAHAVRTISEYLLQNSVPMASHMGLLRDLGRILSVPTCPTAVQYLLEFIKLPLRMSWDEDDAKAIVVGTVKLLSVIESPSTSAEGDGFLDLNEAEDEMQVEPGDSKANPRAWEKIYKKLFKTFTIANPVFHLSQLREYITRHRPEDDRAYDWIMTTLRTLIITLPPKLIIDDSEDPVVAPRSVSDVHAFINKFAEANDYMVNLEDLVQILVRLRRDKQKKLQAIVTKWYASHKASVSLRTRRQDIYRVPTAIVYDQPLPGFPEFVFKLEGENKDADAYEYLERLKALIVNYLREHDNRWEGGELGTYLMKQRSPFRKGLPGVPKGWKLASLVESLGFPPASKGVSKKFKMDKEEMERRYPRPTITNLTPREYDDKGSSSDSEDEEEESGDQDSSGENNKSGDGKQQRKRKPDSAADPQTATDLGIVAKAVKVEEVEQQ